MKTDDLDIQLPLPPEGSTHKERLACQKDAQKWVNHSESDSCIEKQDSLSRRESPTRDSRFKWTNPKHNNNNNNDVKNTSGKDEHESLSSTFNSYTAKNVIYKQTPRLVRNDENEKKSLMDSTGTLSQNLKCEIDFSHVQRLIKDFQNHGNQGIIEQPTTSSVVSDPRLQRRCSSSSSQEVNLEKGAKDSSFTPPMSPPPIPPPPPPVSPFVMPSTSSSSVEASSGLIEKLSTLLGALSSLNRTSSESCPSAGDLSLSLPITSPVSPPTVNRQGMPIPGFDPPGSPAFQMMREKVSFLNQSICTSGTYLKDSHISTQSVATWNHFHPTSPLKYTSSSDNTPPIASPSLNSRSCTSSNENRVYHQEEITKTLSTKSSCSKDDSTKAPLTSPVIDDAGHSLPNTVVQTEMYKTDIPDYENVVITRALTEAEKKSTRAMKEMMNILMRNRDVLKNTSSENENDINDYEAYDYDPLTTREPRTIGPKNSSIKSALKKGKGGGGEGNKVLKNHPLLTQNSSTKTRESAKQANMAKEYLKKDKNSLSEDLSLDEKHGRNNADQKDTYEKQALKQSLPNRTGVNNHDDVSTSPKTPEKHSIQSDSPPDTPELKSGLDLVDNLISHQRKSRQSSPLSKSETLRHEHDTSRNNSTKGSKGRSRSSRETTPRKGRTDGEKKKISPTRKRTVTIKSNKPINGHAWDDITSDISDTELPMDCMSSGLYIVMIWLVIVIVQLISLKALDIHKTKH
jgi:hypothetical protein